MAGPKIWLIDLNEEAQATWNSDELTNEDRIVITAWAEVIRNNGPDALLKNPGQWNDHPLVEGYWKGCRASSFSNQGRLIYYRFDEQGVVQVLRITTTHDYSPPK